MTLHTFGRHDVGRKYHVQAPTPKHVENSIQGVHHARKHHFKTIDLDMTPDEAAVKLGLYAGHLHCNHWEDPFRHDGFRDPKRILHRGDIVSRMSAAEVGRLVAGHRPNLFHISTMETILALCARLGRQALLEPKHSGVWLRQEPWNYLAAVADQYGTHTAVYSLMHGCIPYAERAGFTAWKI